MVSLYPDIYKSIKDFVQYQLLKMCLQVEVRTNTLTSSCSRLYLTKL